MYDQLRSDAPFSYDHLRENSRRFCGLYVGLEACSRRPDWRVKPKLHLVQEMCEMTDGNKPQLTWTYRDEDFGGFMAQLARRKGGRNMVTSSCREVLRKFYTRTEIPFIA